MNARACCLILAAVLLLGFAPAPFPRSERRKTVLDLYGHWEGPKRMVITPTHMTFPDFPDYPYRLRLSPTTNPQEFDLFGVEGHASSGRNFKGIYKVDGETLTLLYNADTAGRPKNFNEGGFREVFKRSQR